MRVRVFWLLPCLMTSVLLCQSAYSDEMWSEIERYCQSLGEGYDAEEGRSMVKECLQEQRSYYTEMPTESSIPEHDSYAADNENNYMESDLAMPVDPERENDCYQQVDEQIQVQLEQNPEFEIDYEAMLDQCFES